MRFKLPLHIHLSTLFLLMTIIISGAITTIGYRMSRDMLAASAEDLTHRAGREVVSEIHGMVGPVQTTVEIFAQGPLLQAKTLQERMVNIKAMSVPLQESAGVSSLYIGYNTGDFFLLQRLANEDERLKLKAPEGTRFIVRSIERKPENSIGKIFYLDETLGLLSEEDRPTYPANYDPRLRDWYLQAQKTLATITTQPYPFYSSPKVGVTIARRMGNGSAVVGADIPLDALGEVLHRQKITPDSQLAIIRADGKVIAYENQASLLVQTNTSSANPELRDIDAFGITPMQGLSAAIREAQDRDKVSRLVSLPDGEWQITVQPLRLKGAEPLYLITAIPEKELFAVALKIRSASIISVFLIMLAAIPVIYLTARIISRSIRMLSKEAEAIRHFDFSAPVQASSIITEVHALAETMGLMKRAIRKFMTITHAVAAEKNFEALLSMLLRETMNVSNASAGALYLAEAEVLTPCVAFTDNNEEFTTALHSMSLSDAPASIKATIAKQEAQDAPLSPSECAQFGLNALVRENGISYWVCVPLLNRQRDLLGIMILQRQTPMDAAQLAFASAISDSASSSLETRGLIRDQKALFEAFTKLIAGAIDAKSPYTGGHCERVPVLTKMLARAACEAKTGPYANFNLNDDEWEAVHIASWLHDCGKVTTPEYVVDKATKLETIYDRIHEVRMRFEVLKRDAEIRSLKAVAAGRPTTTAEAELASELAQLDADFAFIAECNEGGEFMAPEKIDRLTRIASRTWMRTLDDRLGISHEERERKDSESRMSLPVEERVLADKPEHRIKRRESEKIQLDNPWGFHIQVPELQYNRGEMHNLTVSRGTLSDEERYKINEHIVQTIIMLSALPFPRHLQNVPEIAGGHHEKMDGTGYPKRLHKDEMSPVARMMAIADIFEALTATDRPYKKGKTLSEAIDIMSRMKNSQHIDPELFELFLRSGVYRTYAHTYMQPALIDEVDIDKMLA